MSTLHTPPRPPAEVFEHATWVWAGDSLFDLHNCYARFRRIFDLAKVPDRLDFAITVDQAYVLFVNGQLVGRGPARGYQYVWPYDEYDLAPHLRPGRNVIAVRAFNGGRGTFGYVSQGIAGFLAAGHIGAVSLDSDTSNWRCARENGTSKSTVPMSLQLSDQEHHDARVDEVANVVASVTDWAAPEFDDSHWGHAQKVHFATQSGFGSPPWSSNSPRSLPLLKETPIESFTLVGTSRRMSLERTDPASQSAGTRDLADLRFREGLSHNAIAPTKTSTLTTVPAGPNEIQSFLLDLEKLHVGNYSLDVSGAAGGESIDLFCVEACETKDGLITPYFQPGGNCRAAFAVRLVARPNQTRHTFFHAIGHRFVVVTVRNAGVPLSIKLTLHHSVYPLEITGKFETDDTLLADIWKTSAWTQQVCMLDAYVDTPHREQAQWWGDARVQFRNTIHLSDDPQLLRRGIDCIALQQLPNGLTYGHAPTVAHTCILPDFTLTWMLTIHDHYWQTGSTEAFLTHEHRLFAALEYFIEHIDDKTGLLKYDPRYWLFLDWTGLEKQGCPVVYSMWLLHVVNKLVHLCDLTKKKQLKLSMLQVKAWLLNAIENLIDQDTGLIHDGILPDGSINPHCSIHAQTLAILNDVVPEAHDIMIRDSLLPFVRGEILPDIRPSAYWITYVFDVLSARGHGVDVVNCIKRLWQPMITQGTTWEGFAFKPAYESVSHAWSAHPIYHLMQILGGVRQTAPNWKRISFSPTPVGKRYKVVYPTPHGPIRVSFDQDQSPTPVLTLPPGVEVDS